MKRKHYTKPTSRTIELQHCTPLLEVSTQRKTKMEITYEEEDI